MKIYTPDKCTPYRLCSFSSSRNCNIKDAQEILIDVGITKAKQGVNFSEYLDYVKRVWERASAELLIVVPDALGNWQLTYHNYLKYSNELRRFGKVVYVAQELILPAGIDADIIAVPARIQYPYECHRYPQYCAHNILKFAKWLREWRRDKRPLHLLGPAKAVLKLLKIWGALELFDSFDTTAHHLRPNREAEKFSDGKYMAEDGYVCDWLREWLRGVLY
jgi:hypothetical protein